MEVEKRTQVPSLDARRRIKIMAAKHNESLTDCWDAAVAALKRERKRKVKNNGAVTVEAVK